MAAELTHWERRDRADRNAFGEAAYAFCKASRGQDGITGCRFFWVSADRIAILREAEAMHVLDDAPKPEGAKALFDLSDLSVRTDMERWISPRTGQEAATVAGRL